MIAVETLDMTVFSRLRKNQNFVREWVEQILKLLFLLVGFFDSQEKVHLSAVVHIGKKFDNEYNKEVDEALKEGVNLVKLLPLD